MANRRISKVVVLYKDRLTRFSLELIESIAERYDYEMEVVDPAEKTEQEELAEDLVQNHHCIQLQIAGQASK